MFELTGRWQQLLADELSLPYMCDLSTFLHEARASVEVFPYADDVFRALSLTDLPEVKVVILGQDPYHGCEALNQTGCENLDLFANAFVDNVRQSTTIPQAHGLSFSVPAGLRIPPSLRNIYKMRQADLGIEPSHHGDLTAWAEQGVLLLNAVLTVEAHKAGSHVDKGWQAFTDKIIQLISTHNEHVVFLLWGAYAQKKRALVDERKHLILTAAHPSPLSAYRGFFSCQHFSRANTYLQEHGKGVVCWAN